MCPGCPGPLAGRRRMVVVSVVLHRTQGLVSSEKTTCRIMGLNSAPSPGRVSSRLQHGVWQNDTQSPAEGSTLLGETKYHVRSILIAPRCTRGSASPAHYRVVTYGMPRFTCSSCNGIYSKRPVFSRPPQQASSKPSELVLRLVETKLLEHLAQKWHSRHLRLKDQHRL